MATPYKRLIDAMISQADKDWEEAQTPPPKGEDKNLHLKAEMASREGDIYILIRREYLEAIIQDDSRTLKD